MACGLNSKLWTTNSNARLPLTCISIRMRWHTQRHTLRHWRSRQQQLTSRSCTRWANEIISRPYNTNERFRWEVAENYIYSLMINIKQDVDMWPMCAIEFAEDAVSVSVRRKKNLKWNLHWSQDDAKYTQYCRLRQNGYHIWCFVLCGNKSTSFACIAGMCFWMLETNSGKKTKNITCECEPPPFLPFLFAPESWQE